MAQSTFAAQSGVSGLSALSSVERRNDSTMVNGATMTEYCQVVMSQQQANGSMQFGTLNDQSRPTNKVSMI